MTLNYELYVTRETREAAELVAELAKQAIPAGIDIRAGRSHGYAVVLIQDADYQTAGQVRERVFARWQDAEIRQHQADAVAYQQERYRPGGPAVGGDRTTIRPGEDFLAYCTRMSEGL